MATKSIVLLLVGLAFASVHSAEGQQPAKVPLGYLTALQLPASAARTEAFRQGLRDLGYVEGKNIIIEWRSADGNEDRLPALAAELVQLKVDIIVTGGAAVTRPIKAATSTIPIVMTQDRDPVSSGFVASLARPGGNITGLSTLSQELSGKQLELLKETVPKLSRVAVFGTSTRPEVAQELREVELAAGALGVKLQYVDVLTANDIETAFRAAVKGQAETVLFRVLGPILSPHRTEVAALAVKSRLPVMHERAPEVEAGGLMSYGVNLSDLDRRTATYETKFSKARSPPTFPSSSRSSSILSSI
jgi:putative tryptophan/tyrosine transport system substrate-binding protein